MQSTMMNTWPVSPTMAFFPHMATAPGGATNFNAPVKPRVGLGVICRCQPQKYGVECLLLKRGPKFVSPLKWSFPGGRLDEEGDLEDDGEKSTIRELKKECGGGSPGGLPPLIHIESYKSGRTLYHVYVIDCEAQPTKWLQWQPSRTPEHTGEIDPTAGELLLHGILFPAVLGFCWVDFQTLIEECMSISTNDQDRINTSVLQHGLIRWVKANGENILKTLMARSPKLAHHRRYPSTGSYIGPVVGKGGNNTRPRSSSTGSRNYKSLQESQVVVSPTLIPRQVFRPNLHTGLPMGTFTNPPEYLAGPQSRDLGSPISTSNGTQTYQPISGFVINNGSSVYIQPRPQLDTSNAVTSVQTTHHSQSPGRTGEHTDTFVHLEGNIDRIDVQQPYTTSVGLSTTAGNTTALLSSENVSLFDPTAMQTYPQASETSIQSMGNLTSLPPVPLDTHRVGSFHENPRRSQNRRNELCRNFLLNAHCPYGEKCWFLHLDQKPLPREPLLGPGGILTAPVPPVPAAGMWQPGPGFVMDQYLPQYTPPQSPLGTPISPAAMSPSWQLSGMPNRPLLSFVRGGFSVARQQPQVLHLYRPYMFPNHFVSPQNNQTLPTIPDPVLRFRLLSEVMIKDSTDSLIADISCLSVRTDHVYVSYAHVLRDYKVLFGGDRPFNENYFLTAEQSFTNNVTCVHNSKIQPSLVVIGTDKEGVITWDLKRGGTNTFIVDVHEPAEHSDASVTALVHFSTIAGAQVVVVGNSSGEVTWYIAQPPMKTFTVLSSQKAHIPNSVVCLEILGGCLISGSSNGMVCLWNMRSQEPTLADSFQAHSEFLMDIHVLDTSTFLTVGLNQESAGVSAPTINERPEVTGNITHESTDPVDKSTPNISVDEDLTSDLKQFSLAPGSTCISTGQLSDSNYSASIWEYGKPMKNFKTLDNLGPVLCSAFHQQPLFGNRFLATGLKGGAVKIYNLPSFSVASEIHFQDIAERDCIHIALNLSREKENTHNFNMKNPFRDLILTTVWTDGRIMVCQIDPRRNS